MPKHVGIVACSAEGAALCYRTLCREGAALLGAHAHPEVSMHTYPLAEYMVSIRAGDWDQVASLMVSSARKVAGAGAEFVVCPDNTIHQAWDLVAARSPIPWLHIAEVVADEAAARGHRTLAILGTRYLMEGPVYPGVLDRRGIGHAIPDADDRDWIDRLIFDELVCGAIRDEARVHLNGIVSKLASRGCDAVVLGCTEIPLIVDPADCPLPPLDSTRLLARAALRRAL
jgi:aspartate racemase